MATNAPIQIARPYVVIMTPTRELCTQVRVRKNQFVVDLVNNLKSEISHLSNRFTTKHESSHKAASLNVVKSMVALQHAIKTPI